jgi:hypothetical protein
MCALQHVLISPLGGGEGMVDSALHRLGHTRHVALRVPHFLATPLVDVAHRWLRQQVKDTASD